MTVRKNPTNESGIVWGVSDTAGFVRWRAYIQGLSNNGQGANTGWKYANGWWYYDLDRVDQQVMFSTSGLENQTFTLTYWVFRTDGTWEYGPKVNVIHDTLKPSVSKTAPNNNAEYTTTLPVRISSTDASGVEWTRVYLQPRSSGISLSGFTLTTGGWWYKEYSSASVSQDYTLPTGAYNFTVWVKDKAGNITQDPFGIVYVYLKESVVTVLPQPEPVLNPTPTPQPEPTPELVSESDSFDAGFIYPVQADKVYRFENSMPSDAWYDYQPFGALFQFSNQMHLGADLNKGDGDMGVPVYAVYDCIIHDFDDTTANNAWGKWIALKCDAPSGKSFFLTTGQTVGTVYVLYAHLKELVVYTDTGGSFTSAQFVRGTTRVTKGWRIGAVGNANGYYGIYSHLHFEIRVASGHIPGFAYAGFSSPLLGTVYVDPLEFIANNRSLTQLTRHLFVHPYDTNQDARMRVALDTQVWSRQHRSSTGSRRALGYGSHFWKAPSQKATSGSWEFILPEKGWYEVYLYLPHSYATASAVTYTMWHSGTNHANPYVFTLNQSRYADMNERMYLGKFSFNANWRYTLTLEGSALEVHPKIIAMDTLELVLVGNSDLGGGVVSGNDADGDFMEDVWEVSYGLNPYDLSDATKDSDDDEITNLQEYRLNTHPFKQDTDGDGYSDSKEVALGYSPTDPNDCPSCVFSSGEDGYENDVIHDDHAQHDDGTSSGGYYTDGEPQEQNKKILPPAYSYGCSLSTLQTHGLESYALLASFLMMLLIPGVYSLSGRR